MKRNHRHCPQHLQSQSSQSVIDLFSHLYFQVLRYPGRSNDDRLSDALSSSELEALNSLRMATEMRLEGKEDKALRLYQHAIALAPRHPEVLNKYGEYLEHSRQDVVLADQMYFQVRQPLNQSQVPKYIIQISRPSPSAQSTAKLCRTASERPESSRH